MKKTIPLLIALTVFCLSSLQVWAQDEEVVVHTVKKGDTLWDISNMYLKTPWSWPLVWSNNENITNPHLIYPGDKVIISEKDGAYQITIVPAGKEGESRVFTLQQIVEHEGKTIVLAPNYACLIYSDNPLSTTGAVAGKVDIGAFSVVGDVLLIKMQSQTSSTGLAIITPVAEVKHKKSTIGYLYKVIGLAQVKDIQAGVVRARVTYAGQEIKTGDLVSDDLNNLKPVSLTLSVPTLSRAV